LFPTLTRCFATEQAGCSPAPPWTVRPGQAGTARHRSCRDAFGNLALALVLKRIHGRLVVLKNGRYDNAPLDVIASRKKVVDAALNYDTDRYRPRYENFEMKPLFIMTSEL